MPAVPFVKEVKFSVLIFTGTALSESESKQIQKVLELTQSQFKELITIFLIQSDLSLKQELFNNIEPYIDKEAALSKKFNANSACLYLIRPDKYIGFRSQPICAHSLKNYLENLFG